MEYGSTVLVMSKLATVHMCELRFGNFGQLKRGSQCCLTQSNNQESPNLQSIKNKVHIMIFSHYT